jgi:hypothetical protein
MSWYAALWFPALPLHKLRSLGTIVTGWKEHCSLGGGGWLSGNASLPFVADPSCASPLQLNLADGPYVLEVTATDKVRPSHLL